MNKPIIFGALALGALSLAGCQSFQNGANKVVVAAPTVAAGVTAGVAVGAGGLAAGVVSIANGVEDIANGVSGAVNAVKGVH